MEDFKRRARRQCKCHLSSFRVAVRNCGARALTGMGYVG
jgi:hypothetical protein